LGFWHKSIDGVTPMQVVLSLKCQFNGFIVFWAILFDGFRFFDIPVTDYQGTGKAFG
jgi:hypothetical protein